jgi:protein-L-isoaspartate(D-aspartate) O-methyltransferase
MLREIAADVRATAEQIVRSALAPRVAAAMAKVPRHEFVPSAAQSAAYVNAPLPIGHGQTISQPYIVAAMTDLAQVGEGDTVLEVGTGCGYQAAVLAELVDRVYSIEWVPELAHDAAERLARLGYANVEVRVGDGCAGWPEHAPFDAVVVTAAARGVPQPLIAQLAEGRRMVIPLEGGFFGQDLSVIERGAGGRVEQRKLLPVRFVSLRQGASEGR